MGGDGMVSALLTAGAVGVAGYVIYTLYERSEDQKIITPLPHPTGGFVPAKENFEEVDSDYLQKELGRYAGDYPDHHYQQKPLDQGPIDFYSEDPALGDYPRYR